MVVSASAVISGQTTSKEIEATTDDGRIVILKSDGTWSFKPEPKIKPLGVTMAGFTALKEGMSYEDAVAILGREGEVQSESKFGDITTIMYQWDGARRPGLGSSMNAMFQNGKLVSKAQFGLK